MRRNSNEFTNSTLNIPYYAALCSTLSLKRERGSGEAKQHVTAWRPRPPHSRLLFYRLSVIYSCVSVACHCPLLRLFCALLSHLNSCCDHVINMDIRKFFGEYHLRLAFVFSVRKITSIDLIINADFASVFKIAKIRF